MVLWVSTKHQRLWNHRRWLRQIERIWKEEKRKQGKRGLNYHSRRTYEWPLYLPLAWISKIRRWVFSTRTKKSLEFGGIHFQKWEGNPWTNFPAKNGVCVRIREEKFEWGRNWKKNKRYWEKIEIKSIFRVAFTKSEGEDQDITRKCTKLWIDFSEKEMRIGWLMF